MRYRHKLTGNVIDAIQMWDAGEARFQSSPSLRWEHRGYIAAVMDINPPIYRTLSADDIARHWEPIEPAQGGVLPEGAYKVGETHDTPHVDMLSTWVEFPKASPVINLHVHIAGGDTNAEYTLRRVMEALRKEGVKL